MGESFMASMTEAAASENALVSWAVTAVDSVALAAAAALRQQVSTDLRIVALFMLIQT
jgi:hypothetical protein